MDLKNVTWLCKLHYIVWCKTGTFRNSHWTHTQTETAINNTPKSLWQMHCWTPTWTDTMTRVMYSKTTLHWITHPARLFFLSLCPQFITAPMTDKLRSGLRRICISWWGLEHEPPHVIFLAGTTSNSFICPICSMDPLTLNLPTMTIVAQPFNIIKWQVKFNPVA